MENSGRRKQAARGEPLKWLKEKIKEPGNDCLFWPFGRDSWGYGVIRWEGEKERVSVVSLILSGYPKQKGMGALHSCGVTICVNPNHLRWGSQKMNHDDSVAHGTNSPPPIRIGQENHKTKLTENEVREIRKSYVPGIPGLQGQKNTITDLAQKFGMSRYAIHSIIIHKTWKHI